MLEDLRHTLIGLPGAKSVSWANAAPLEKQGYSDAVVLNDHPKPAGAPAFVFWRTAATPEYFDSLGIRLIAGRSFNDSDRSGTEPVSIISESTAKRFWPNESAVGKLIKPYSAQNWSQVVGVAQDVAQYSLTGFPSWVDGAQYVPFSQTFPPNPRGMAMTAFISSSDPQLAARELAVVMRSKFPDVVVSRVAMIDAVRRDSVSDQLSITWLLGLLAVLGLILGFVGVYGVMSNRASQRTKEIGIRIALGATAGEMLGMVLKEAAFVSVIGCTAGVLVSTGLTRFLKSLLFGITTHDVFTFTLAPVVLLLASIIAALIPGIRASRQDPAVTLRQD